MENWAVFSVGLLEMKLQWTFIYKSLYGYMPSFFLVEYTVGIHLTFNNTNKLFSEWSYHFLNLLIVFRVSVAQIVANTQYVQSLYLSILIDMISH